MELKDTFDDCINQLITKVNDLDFNNDKVYKWWLAQTYFMTMHSQDLLLYIGDHSKDERTKLRWHEHASEEVGHHNLALKDLEFLNEDISDFYELPETKSIYQRQWFLAKQIDPNICFGWVLSLEGLAALLNKDMVSSLIDSYGPKGTRFVKLHTHEDPEHLESAFKSLEKIPNPALITENLKDSTYFYLSMLSKIEEISNEDSLNLAA